MREIYFFLFMNILSFSLFGWDKWKAIHHRWRISERNLLLSALTGGFIGAFLAMHLFHHKTKHRKFTWGIPAIAILEAAILILYIHGYLSLP